MSCQRPDISWIFRTRDSAVARLSAVRAAFMGRRGGRALCMEAIAGNSAIAIARHAASE